MENEEITDNNSGHSGTGVGTPSIDGIDGYQLNSKHSDDNSFTYGDDNGEMGEKNFGANAPKPRSTLETIAGVAGNVLEWYDFAVFGYFGDILGEVFFPPNQKGHSAMIESFAVFGGAFLMRPVGGMLLGYIGDTYGRKKALVISIFLMAFPTFAMGCLPPYSAVGPLAIVLLTIVRLLQGLSVGGQLVSSLVYTVEAQPKSQWGYYGSFVLAAANLGTLLGGIVGYVMRSTLTREQLLVWGWRIPFLSGIFVSIPGFYLRSHGEDEENDVPASTTTERENPIRVAFRRENLRALLSSSLVPMLWSGGFYLTFVWMAIYMEDLVDDAPIAGAFGINSAALFLSVCLTFPLAGILSDRIGRVRVMTIGGLGMGILSPIMVTFIGKGDPATAFFAQLIMGLALSFWGAPMCAWLAESFSPAARLTSVAIGYNVAQAIVGGSSPAVATLMVDKIGKDSPGYLLSIYAFLALIGLRCVAPKSEVERDTGREDMNSLVPEITNVTNGELI